VIIFGSVQSQLEKAVDIWFDKAPLGKNTLGDKMKNLSKQLSAIYLLSPLPWKVKSVFFNSRKFSRPLLQ
jgi:hypothetical protein